MRQLLRRISPAWARHTWTAIKEQVFLRRNRDAKARFSEIYSKNHWRNPESVSGYGSTVSATRQAREGLERLVQLGSIRSILDVPCGDFNWMKLLHFDGRYTGGDIVEALVAKNQQCYGDGRSFVVLDVINDPLPKADLVMCRECLNHLSLAEAATAFRNLQQAPHRYLVVTHYPDHGDNTDQQTSFRYRSLNLTRAPFSARPPDMLIEESEQELGKCLAVWDFAKGPVVAQ